jgi:hypothetical protein
MLHPTRRLALLSLILLPLLSPDLPAAEPLHHRIDALIATGAAGRPVSAAADDAEFLRRVYLDFAGRIPSVVEARAFFAEQTSEKRTQLIDALLDGPEYPRRMQELFHVWLMERRGDHPQWTNYLRQCFEANKPWDQMAREILRATPSEETTRGAAFFYAKRLEHYGENPVDYPGLTRDVGRLFLGKDFRCAQCHDHLFVKEYTQHDFQGLFAFFQNTYLVDLSSPTVGEKPLAQKLAFMSVFKKVRHETGPRIPGMPEIDVPVLEKGKEFLKPPDPKAKAPGIPRFSPLAQLAQELPTSENPAFARNIVNRLWAILMGRGLVHPLDLHHAGNPPSHPELLDLLAREMVAHRFDIKWLLRELALTQTYQRSSQLPEGQESVDPPLFLTASERRLSAEQLLGAILEATGEKNRTLAPVNKPAAKGEKPADPEALRTLFAKAFAGPAGEPEEDNSPSLKAVLFVLNDDTVLSWLTPRPGNLVDRLDRMSDARQVAEELYLAILTRLPTAEEKKEVADYLAANAGRRSVALGHLAWALLASAEFGINH